LGDGLLASDDGLDPSGNLAETPEQFAEARSEFVDDSRSEDADGGVGGNLLN